MLRSVGVLCRRPPARWHAFSRPRASGGLAHHRLMSTEEIEALLCTKGGAAPLAERRRTAAELMKAAAPWTAAPHGEPEMSVEPGGSTPTQQWWTLSIPTSVEGDEPVIVSRVSVCHTGSNRGLTGRVPGRWSSATHTREPRLGQSVYTPEVVGSSETASPPTGLVEELWVHAALPTEVSVPLIRAVVDDLRVGGCATIAAIAPLPGLCGWIVRGQRWEEKP